MTREEAINVVRNIYQTDAEKEALQALIPELRESEDERIREKYIVRIPAKGSRFNEWQDVDETIQKRLIEDAKQSWLRTIRTEKRLVSKPVHDSSKNPPYQIDYSVEPNPYYGWAEDDLEIVVEQNEQILR